VTESGGWRWLCTECWAEGPGDRPDECPECGCADAWYQTAAHGGRPMKEVFEDLFSQLLGAPKQETKH